MHIVAEPRRLEIKNTYLIYYLLLLLHTTTYVPLPYMLSESRFYLLHAVAGYSLGGPNKIELNLKRMGTMWDSNFDGLYTGGDPDKI
jgi:hypothetical protein